MGNLNITNVNYILDNKKCFRCGCEDISIGCDTGENYGTEDLLYIDILCMNPNCPTRNYGNWFLYIENKISGWLFWSTGKEDVALFNRLKNLQTPKNTVRFSLDREWTIEVKELNEEKNG